jgi:hypothetical protein
MSGNKTSFEGRVLQIYEALVKQDPEKFSADVTRVEKLLTELPR